MSRDPLKSNFEERWRDPVAAHPTTGLASNCYNDFAQNAREGRIQLLIYLTMIITNYCNHLHEDSNDYPEKLNIY